MSDTYYDDTEEAPPHPADPPQQLVDFVGSFTDEQAGEVFRDAAIQVQDYMVRRDIAADNQAAADRMVNNLGAFKDGLASMAAADPAATFLGLDLVPGMVDGIVNTHPFLPDDQRQGVYDQLTSDMQRDIARSGVMSLADKNDAAARALLDNPRITGLFDDRDRASLNGYIGAMATARDADSAALARQRVQDEQRTRDFSAVRYFGALVDPTTQELQFPGDWAQRVTADPTLPPGDTASMLSIYGRLQAQGDASATDPFVAADLIAAAANGSATTPAVLQRAGTDLRMADAVTIAGMAGSTPEAGKAGVRALNEVVQRGRAELADPSNGPAGQQAFAKYVNWLLPAVRTGAVSLNPADPGYAGGYLPQFAPNGTNLVDGTVQAPMEDRPSLSDIFGARRVR